MYVVIWFGINDHKTAHGPFNGYPEAVRWIEGFGFHPAPGGWKKESERCIVLPVHEAGWDHIDHAHGG